MRSPFRHRQSSGAQNIAGSDALKKPRNAPLPLSDEMYNRKLVRVRIFIEHLFGRICGLWTLLMECRDGESSYAMITSALAMHGLIATSINSLCLKRTKNHLLAFIIACIGLLQLLLRRGEGCSRGAGNGTSNVSTIALHSRNMTLSFLTLNNKYRGVAI